MTTRNSLLQCLHLGNGKSWLGKRFLHSQFIDPKEKDGQNTQIVVNYNEEEFRKEAIIALARQFGIHTVIADRFYHEDYEIVLTVKPWLYTTDYDLIDYNPYTQTLFNKVTKLALHETDLERFRQKKCTLTNDVYWMFIRKEEQMESVRRNLYGYIANDWTFYKTDTGEMIEFLAETYGESLIPCFRWKCHNYKSQVVKFSIGECEYETTTTHPIDYFTLFNSMKELVEKTLH